MACDVSESAEEHHIPGQERQTSPACRQYRHGVSQGTSRGAERCASTYNSNSGLYQCSSPAATAISRNTFLLHRESYHCLSWLSSGRKDRSGSGLGLVCSCVTLKYMTPITSWIGKRPYSSRVSWICCQSGVKVGTMLKEQTTTLTDEILLRYDRHEQGANYHRHLYGFHRSGRRASTKCPRIREE